MGLDKPLIVQFVHYIGAVLTGDMGTSVSTGKKVADDLKRVRFPPRSKMATLGILIGVILGVPMGVYAASLAKGKPIDQLNSASPGCSAIRYTGVLA